jgi:hypothetical protein
MFCLLRRSQYGHLKVTWSELNFEPEFFTLIAVVST